MPLLRRFHLPALFCALAVLFCELVSRPYANMGIADDWTYIHSAQRLAATGHIFYNGVETPMLGWQLYLGAAFIKLFGFSLTAVRMSTLLVAVLMAFVLQRTLVRAGVNERNATLGTLALVLSPLYLMLSVTYMTDIDGLFAVVVCLYGCLRALQAATDRATIFWLYFAVAANAVLGTARQIAWLGVLVMVPSTLYVLGQRGMWRDGRRVLWAGGAAALAGALFIFGCMQWFARQPYTVVEHLRVAWSRASGLNALAAMFHVSLELPLLLLAIVVAFIPGLSRNIRLSLKVTAVFFGVCFLVVGFLRLTHGQDRPLLEPMLRDWFTRFGWFSDTSLAGVPPVFLGTYVRLALTVASLGGMIGLIVSLLGPRAVSCEADESHPVPWNQLGVLVAPFAIAYSLLLIPRATSRDGMFDRYLLELLLVALPCLVRYYQQRIQPRLPRASTVMVCLTAMYSIAVVHNMFSFYRARVALAAEVRASGVPDTAVDNGWEYNFAVELRHSDHLNDPRVEVPANAYTPVSQAPGGLCTTGLWDRTPHVRPVYGASFDPDACYGPAPFAPVHYSRWLASPGSLYVVRYRPPGRSDGDPRSATLKPILP